VNFSAWIHQHESNVQQNNHDISERTIVKESLQGVQSFTLGYSHKSGHKIKQNFESIVNYVNKAIKP